MTKQEIIDKIFNTIQKQSFFDWYNEGGEFDAYISGAANTEDIPSKEEIKDQIAKMFNL